MFKNLHSNKLSQHLPVMTLNVSSQKGNDVQV
jgi:hypothetical protein